MNRYHIANATFAIILIMLILVSEERECYIYYCLEDATTIFTLLLCLVISMRLAADEIMIMSHRCAYHSRRSGITAWYSLSVAFLTPHDGRRFPDSANFERW